MMNDQSHSMINEEKEKEGGDQALAMYKPCRKRLLHSRYKDKIRIMVKIRIKASYSKSHTCGFTRAVRRFHAFNSTDQIRRIGPLTIGWSA